jgi:hypothetical protein
VTRKQRNNRRGKENLNGAVGNVVSLAPSRLGDKT